jgi:hypothetical protein
METVPQNPPFRPGSLQNASINYLIIPSDLIIDNQPTGNMKIQNPNSITRAAPWGSGTNWRIWFTWFKTHDFCAGIAWV